MAEKSVIASISQAEERHFKTLQLPALRAVVSEPAQQKRRFFLLLYFQPAILSTGGFTLDSGGKRVPTVVTGFRTRARQGPKAVVCGHGCHPVPIRPTQWLTRPNGAVLSPPAGRRSSLCQQHRDPGIEWTCISSLCLSAPRPPKVGPGCRPELRAAYSQTLCLPHPLLTGGELLWQALIQAT